MILDSAVDNIEKVTGWTLTRHYSFPKLAFKTSPGVDRPSTISCKVSQPDDPASPRQENMPESSNRQQPASTAGQQPLAKPLVTELSADSAVKAAGKGSKSSGFKFPTAKGKQEKAPFNSLPFGRTTPSQSSSGADIATSSRESDSGLMTAVATTRMEAVSLQAGVPPAAEGVAEGVVQPKYEVVYRGHMDLSQAWEGPGVDVAPARYPKVSI